MANEAYLLTGNAIPVTITLAGLANQAGRVSTQIDLGASPRPFIYSWSFETQLQATPTQYATVDLYIAEAPDSDATQITGDVGATDAALADTDMLRNLKYIGSVVSENAAAAEVLVGNSEFTTYSRYISIVAFNDSGAAISATGGESVLVLAPKSIQGQ